MESPEDKSGGKKKSKELDIVLEQFAALKFPDLYEEIKTSFVQESKTVEQKHEQITKLYADICLENRWDMKDSANDIRIDELLELGALNREKKQKGGTTVAGQRTRESAEGGWFGFQMWVVHVRLSSTLEFKIPKNLFF